MKTCPQLPDLSLNLGMTEVECWGSIPGSRPKWFKDTFAGLESWTLLLCLPILLLNAAPGRVAIESGRRFTDVSRLFAGFSETSSAQFSTDAHGDRRFVVGEDANDTNAPTLVAAVGSPTFDKVTVTFDELVDSVTAGNQFNYYITENGGNSLNVTNATLNPDGTNVTLTLDAATPLLPNTLYTLTVTNVQDLSGNVIVDSTITFRSVAFTTTTLTASPNPSFIGNVIIFIAYVRTQPDNISATNGTVTFREGATVLAADVPVDTRGLARFQTSTFAQDLHVITADYDPGAGYLASTGSVVVTVNACTPNLTVTSTNDNGPGSLRQALMEICPGGTIDFTNALNGSTIALTNHWLLIDKNLTVLGPGANLLAVSGNGRRGMFQIYSGSTSLLAGLTITNDNRTTNFESGIFNSGSLIVSNCSIGGNATRSFGGGIFNNSQGTLTLQNSTLSGNWANDTGGGIDNLRGVVTVQNSTISGNHSAWAGGGIFNYFGVVTVQNSTVSGNSARYDGGAIVNYGGVLTLQNTTVSGNLTVDTFGAGLSASGTEWLTNCIVAGNYRGIGGTLLGDISGSVDGAGYNLIGDARFVDGITNGINGNIVGNGGISPLAITNILNTNLAFNGGPTRTHALVPGSPAIDAGTNAALADLPFDQRGEGFARLVDGRVDIGAYEVQASAGTLRITAYERRSSSEFWIQFIGAADVSYRVEWSADLETWNNLGPAAVAAPGEFEYLDTAATPNRRFYRVTSP